MSLKSRLIVVTDSTCDLPENLIAENAVRIVPALVNWDNRSFLDGVDITREQVYTALENGQIIQTAAPAPGTFANLYDNLLRENDHIISIHASGRLSGIHNSALVGSNMIDPNRITVVDSLQLSMGLGWIVRRACQAVSSGTSLEGVLNLIVNVGTKVRTFAVLRTLQYIARSGRINLVQAGLGSLLEIKPTVTLRNGEIVPFSRVRTWVAAVRQFHSRLETLLPIEALAIMHTNAADEAKDLLQKLGSSIGPIETCIVNVTPVIGVHVGPGSLGFSAIVSS